MATKTGGTGASKRITTKTPAVTSAAKVTRPSNQKATVSSTTTTTAQPSHEQIARRAYEYYVQRGYSHGNHVEDWYRAINELTAKR